MATTVDLSALNLNIGEAWSRILDNAFDIPNGGGMNNDLKAFGSEGSTSFLWWDYSEDKAFIQRTTTDTDPGRLVYIQHLTSAVASGSSCQGMQIRARATGTGTIAGGTDGAEIKSGLNSDSDTGTLAQARGVIGNVDAKKGTITTAHLFEGQVDVGSGGTITTLKGFRASMNNSGTITTSYAFIVETANTSYNWDYGFYMADNQADVGMFLGDCTTGINIEGTTTTGILIDGASTTSISVTGAATKQLGLANTTSGATGRTTASIEITSTQAHTSGYEYALFCSITKSGAGAAGDATVIGADIYPSMTTSGWLRCFEGYIGTISNKTVAGASGFVIYMEDVGTACTYANGLMIGRVITNTAIGSDSFIHLRNHGATAGTTVIQTIGGAGGIATNLIHANSITPPFSNGGSGDISFSGAWKKIAISIASVTYYLVASASPS